MKKQQNNINMRFNLKTFKQAVTECSKLIRRNPVLAITELILLQCRSGIATLISTDLENTIKISFPIPSDEVFDILIDPKFFKSIKSKEEFIDIYLDKDIITYKIGDLHINQDSTDIDDYPNLNTETKLITQISGELFAEFIDISKYQTSYEMRPSMTGINILGEKGVKGISLTASDGHCLKNTKLKTIKNKYDFDFVIPNKSAKLLSKFKTENIEIFTSKIYVVFKFKQGVYDIEFMSRTINQKYPDFNAVIPKENKNVITINKSELLNAVMTAYPLLNSITGEINIDLKNECLIGEVEKIKVFESKLNLTSSTEDIIRFNCRFLIRCI